MAKKLMAVEIQGKAASWVFEFVGDTRHLADWRADGIEVNVIENKIPMWAVELGLTRIYAFIQNCINFKSPL